jgi:ribonuclease T1
MTPESNSNPPPTPLWQNQWVKIGFSIAALVALAWLNTSTTGVVAPKGQVAADRSRTTASPPTDEPRRTRKAKHSAEDSENTDVRHPNPTTDEADSDTPSSAEQTAPPSSNSNRSLVVRNVRVVDEDGEVVYRGDVDLAPTLDRIEQGTRLSFSHDGIVFENRERRLPPKPNGYYHEFVQPTPHQRGPGGQRLVLGENGEVYYSSDHYRTFQRVR